VMINIGLLIALNLSIGFSMLKEYIRL